MKKIDKIIILGLIVYGVTLTAMLTLANEKATHSPVIKSRFKTGNLDTSYVNKTTEAPWNYYTKEQIEKKECKPTIDPLMGWVIKN